MKTAMLLMLLVSQDPATQVEPVEITGVPTPYLAVSAALNDAQNLSSQGYLTAGVRYVWIPSASRDNAALVSFVLNSVVSRSDINHVPFVPRSPIQMLEEGCLVRVDLVGLAPRQEDFREIADTWDTMRNPQFLVKNRIPQKGVLDLGDLRDFDGVPHKTIEVDAFTQNGKTYNKRWVPLTNEERAALDVAEKVEDFDPFVFGPHVDLTQAALLSELTQCTNPIIWCVSFFESALTQVDGGKYYEFMGLKKSTEEGKSDEDLLLENLGVSIELLEKLRAEQRVGMVTSQVTGKTRRIDFFTSPSRPASCQGLIAITQDIFDESANDAQADVFLNLLEFKSDGTEGIFERRNGHLAFWLADADGNLVDEAPPNLVSDHEIPAPYTRRLQPAISCIRCHGKVGDDGWRPFVNQVRELTELFDVVGEVGQDDLLETLARLAELYSGKLDKPIRRAREDQSDTIVICTGDVQNEDGLPWQYEDVSKRLSALWVEHFYSPVSTRQACIELGYDPTDDPLGRFVELMGALSDGTEDVRIALLMKGIPINRTQWNEVYVDASLRALESNLLGELEE